MKNTLKLIVLIATFMHGSAAMSLAVQVTVSTSYNSKDWEASLICPGHTGRMSGADTKKGTCVLKQEGDLLLIEGYFPKSHDHCAFTLRNNELKKGYCSEFWKETVIEPLAQDMVGLTMTD